MNRLSIIYSITDKCNRHCSYCMMPRKNKEITSYSKLIINRLKLIDKRIHCDITGGEPTISEDFEYILSNLSSLPNIERIIFTTNGNKTKYKNVINWIKKKENLIILTIHLENFDEEIFNALEYYSKCNCEVRIAYISKYKKLCQKLIFQLSKYKLYKLLVLPIYINDITDTDSIISSEAKLPNNFNKYCLSAGINLLPDGRWNKCNNSNIYNKPIFITSNSDLYKNVLYKCKYKRCFFFSENHKIFDSKNIDIHQEIF